MKNILLILLSVLFLFSCGKETSDLKTSFDDTEVPELGMTEKELYDKILGTLVGSAIGDAMGAPTEMWSRENIQLEYGFIDGLDSMVREVSPEGIWIANLPAGGTTDDTRWKMLTSTYLLSQNQTELDSKDFAKHILKTYKGYVDEFSEIKGIDPEPFEAAALKMGWLNEWAKVSQPFIDENLIAYSDSLNKFYGGEMVCAGLLYAPAIGAYFPGNPEKAYQEAYKLSIFDLGYARDLTGLAAAMTSAGMKPKSKKEDLLAALRLDPQGYFESRLVGRTAHKLLKEALFITEESSKKDSLGNQLLPNSLALQFAFAQLDMKQQDMPFHAGEIYLQTITAMIFADFDFMGTLIFLTNYGRDNDTTAAVAGGILGAFYGFENLPKAEREKVIKVNREILGTDLEKMASDLTAHLIGR